MFSCRRVEKIGGPIMWKIKKGYVEAKKKGTSYMQ
jgi:hypothetical protein